MNIIYEQVEFFNDLKSIKKRKDVLARITNKRYTNFRSNIQVTMWNFLLKLIREHKLSEDDLKQAHMLLWDLNTAGGVHLVRKEILILASKYGVEYTE